MSATFKNEEADHHTTPEPTMFPETEVPIAPEAPGASYAPTAAREAALDAVERALAASLRLQRTMPLPSAPQLNEKDERDDWPRRRGPFDGDVRRMRPRASLEPVAMAVPPPEEQRTGAGRLLLRIVGAVALAAIAGLFAVGALPLPFGTTAEGETAVTSLRSRIFAAPAAPQQAPVMQQPIATPVAVARPAAGSPEQAALVERFVALRQQQAAAAPSQAIVPQAVKSERIVMPAAPSVRALEREEIAVLYDRSQALIEQGDIASARLMLTRAAEAGDARSALALGTTYDPDMLKKLGVLGVAADPAQAQAWYNKAVELGSPDAALRLERLAQAAR
jgi:hypothetical protein